MSKESKAVIEGLSGIELENMDADILSTDRFRYPDMGDYYLNAVDDPYYKRLQEAMSRIGMNENGTYDMDGIGAEGLSDEAIADQLISGNSPQALKFYLEEPPVKELGDYPELGVTFFKAKVNLTDKDREMGYFDADTIPYKVASVDAGTPEVTDKIIGSYKKRMLEMGIEDDELEMSVRLVGIDAPEVAHWKNGSLSNEEFDSQTTTKKYSEIKDMQEEYIALRSNARPSDDIVHLVRIHKDENIWREYDPASVSSSAKKWFTYLQKMEEKDPERIFAGAMLQRKLQQLINAAGNEVYIVADGTSLNYKSARYPSAYDVDAWTKGIGQLKYMWSQIEDYNRYKYTGYSSFGQDAYGRWLGSAYVKYQGQWVNLAKYMITQSSAVEVMPDFTDLPSFEASGGSASQAFKLHSYKYDNQVFYDAHGEVSKEMDDRRRVQKEIFKMDFDAMKEWNVTIGDTTLFVPPTSIRSQTSTTYERLPVIRGKGSMTKGGNKVQKMVELTVYFNEERGINGYPFKDTLPNGEEITYYMNGLRSLISQFKFTPFLPIENNYINGVLNIDAVTLVNLQLTSNPSYPRLIKAVLTLQHFDYLQYMPELPLDLDKDENSYYNPFSTVFNFELMRWYYQQPLIRGNRYRHLSINSTEYLKAVEGSRTALFPMDFVNSDFKIYTANEEHLKRMYQIKVMKTKNSTTRTMPYMGETEEGLIQDLARFYDPYMDLETDKEVKLALDFFKNHLDGDEEYYVILPEKEKAGNPYFTDDMAFRKMKINDDGSFSNAESNTTKTLDMVNQIGMAVAARMMTAQDLSRDLIVRFDSIYGKREGEKAVLGIVFSMSSPFMTESAIDNIVRSAEGTIGEIMNQHVKDGKMVVEYELDLTQREVARNYVSTGYDVSPAFARFSKDGEWKLRKDNMASYVAYIKSLADNIEENGYVNMDDVVSGSEVGDDTTLLENLTYDEIPLGDIRISNIACVYGNTFTQIGLNGTDGFAAQYLGGQDVVIELNFETTSAYSAGVLNGLPSLASHLVSSYKLIMPSAPIRFESDITRLFGVVEVAVEQVDVQTVPGQPGLYSISMRLVSVDRTMRRREGIEKVNEFAYGGITTNQGTQDIKSRTFAELNKRFGEAELFPDLELPTIEELEGGGFYFLRHTFDKTRTFPDPDFYYNYGHVLQSQIFRESVLRTEVDRYEKIWEDTKGGRIVTDVAKNVGYEEIEKNDNYCTREEALGLVDKMKEISSSKLIDDFVELNIPSMDLLNSYNSQLAWELGEETRVILMEKEYAEALLNRNSLISRGESASETDWLAEKVQSVDEAVDLIDAYLSKPIGEDSGNVVRKNDRDHYKICARVLLGHDEIKEIFTRVGIKKNRYNAFMDHFGEMAYAVACARTGRMEYRDGLDKEDYGPDVNYIGFKVSDMQDGSGKVKIKDVSDISQAVEFGQFRIKMYYPTEAKAITGENISYLAYRERNTSDINTQLVLLDPYYSKASVEEIEEYKKGCVMNTNYAFAAYIRICLVWLRRLIKDRLVPNVVLDLFREEFEEELRLAKVDATEAFGETEAEKALGDDGAKQLEKQIKSYIEFLEDGEKDINNGKAFLLGALFCGEMSLYNLVANRSFSELNALKLSLTSTSSDFKRANSDYAYLRKLLLACIPAKIIDGTEELSTRFDDAIQDHKHHTLERKYIEFAEDPNIYVRHAFYDMCVHDMRGRMARAFPSFYLVLIDEGQEIGMYKLNDNFYNINAVSEIQVHRSRKIPADTCRIVLSNLYHSYTTDDEDKQITYEYNPLDIFNSVFRPGEIYGREQEKRLRQQPLNRVKLTAGTRIHVRLGFGANAATLPVAFNGRITEIHAGDVMELVAQGDGVELNQPILEDIDAEEVQNEDKILPWLHNTMLNAETPKAIIDGILNTKGSFIKDKAKELSNNYFKNPHKYGITNFGDTRFNTIFKSGEVVQNIFEGMSKPKWGDLENGKDGNWNTDDVPKISTELMGKSVWDILHFCASATPDFIVGIAPFGMRSTIFHGHPRYYYAFDYILNENGQVQYEKRKPYQQYHMVSSFSDIISNNIKADSTRIRTNAIGTYKSTGLFFNESIKKTDRLYVDWDIYPEHQKSMIYDTQLWDKGETMSIGLQKNITRWMNSLTELFTEDADTTSGLIQNSKKIARRMTANALKDSIRDMYAGDIILLGIPSLKPHDRLIINDTYENMHGHVTVEAVTHSLSTETGLTTTVIPDCISVVDDQFEKGARSVTDYINTTAMTAYGVILAGSLMLRKGAGPMTKLSAWAATKATPEFAKTFINEKILRKENVGDAKAVSAAADVAEEIVDNRRLLSAGRLMAGSTAGIPGLLAAVLWTAVEAGATYTLGVLGQKEVEKRLKNSQILMTFPVKHNGKVMTSGLTGEVGSVYGSVNYNKLGTVESVLGFLDMNNNGLSDTANFFIDFLISDNTQKTIREHNMGVINRDTSDEANTELDIQEYLSTAAKDEGAKIAGYKRLLVTPRVDINDEMAGDSLGQMYEKIALLDTRMLESQIRITEDFTYLGNDTVLKDMANNDFFRIVWKESASTESEMMDFRGINAPIKVYKKQRSDGSHMYDLPFLKDDAISVMKQIVTRASYMNTRYDDKNGRDAVVSITSALIVGEEKASLAGMGYAFTIEGDGINATKFLPEAIKGLYEYNTSEYENGASINKEIFVYRDLGGNKFQISVLPPKV